jgi:hypothetical protein
MTIETVSTIVTYLTVVHYVMHSPGPLMPKLVEYCVTQNVIFNCSYHYPTYLVQCFHTSTQLPFVTFFKKALAIPHLAVCITC